MVYVKIFQVLRSPNTFNYFIFLINPFSIFYLPWFNNPTGIPIIFNGIKLIITPVFHYLIQLKSIFSLFSLFDHDWFYHRLSNYNPHPLPLPCWLSSPDLRLSGEGRLLTPAFSVIQIYPLRGWHSFSYFPLCFAHFPSKWIMKCSMLNEYHRLLTSTLSILALSISTTAI